MPMLDINRPDGFSLLMGRMCYPDTGSADTARAAECARQITAAAMSAYSSQAREISQERLSGSHGSGIVRIDDMPTRQKRGAAAGATLWMLFVLHCSDPKKASWNAAADLVEEQARDPDFPSDKTTLLKCVKQFGPVLHFWGVLWMREGGIRYHFDDRDVCIDDFRRFLTEAETLRQWGQTTRSLRKPNKPFLPAKMWTVPEQLLLLGPPHGPEDVKLHALALDEAFLKFRRTPGRPRVV